jgi:hypothetical protein
MKQASGARTNRFGWSVLGGTAVVGLAILALGGYLLDWTWTGFSGNTLWDWLKLLLLPLIVTALTIRLSQGGQGGIGRGLDSSPIQTAQADAVRE